MTKNNKPILSILIDEGKRARFADLARHKSLSMSYLVNQAIDRMLETDVTIDIHRDSIVTSVSSNYVDSSVVGMTRIDIEQLIKSSIGSIDIEQLVKSYVDSQSSSVVSIDEVNRLIAKSSNELLELVRSDTPTLEIIKATIEHSISPLTDRLEELETYTQSKTGELISFTQLAKDLGYAIPDGVKASAPQKVGAGGLIAFAATLGHSYVWHGKNQKLYKTN